MNSTNADELDKSSSSSSGSSSASSSDSDDSEDERSRKLLQLQEQVITFYFCDMFTFIIIRVALCAQWQIKFIIWITFSSKFSVLCVFFFLHLLIMCLTKKQLFTNKPATSVCARQFIFEIGICKLCANSRNFICVY